MRVKKNVMAVALLVSTFFDPLHIFAEEESTIIKSNAVSSEDEMVIATAATIGIKPGVVVWLKHQDEDSGTSALTKLKVLGIKSGKYLAPTLQNSIVVRLESDEKIINSTFAGAFIGTNI